MFTHQQLLLPTTLVSQQHPILALSHSVLIDLDTTYKLCSI